VLHLTNGDCAAQALSRAGIAPEDILPWRDVLHEGPVPAGLTLEELSAVRAQFLAQAGSGDHDAIRTSFYERDVRMAGSQAEDEVVCWFESDLYDQLQLLQCLDWYADASHRPARLTLVQADRGPDGGFEALGALEPSRAQVLLQGRAEVSAGQLETAVHAWAAFRAAAPLGLERLWRAGELASLPCLADAVKRLFEELPWTDTGLSRSERTALECLAAQPSTGAALFRAVRAKEPRPFLGDVWFWRALDSLATGAQPLIARQLSVAERGIEAAVLSLTPAGRAVLEGRLSWAPEMERWLGGTRLWRRDSVWLWDGARQCVIQG
jgi:hypothetical protein